LHMLGLMVATSAVSSALSPETKRDLRNSRPVFPFLFDIAWREDLVDPRFPVRCFWTDGGRAMAMIKVIDRDSRSLDPIYLSSEVDDWPSWRARRSARPRVAMRLKPIFGLCRPDSTTRQGNTRRRPRPPRRAAAHHRLPRRRRPPRRRLASLRLQAEAGCGSGSALPANARSSSLCARAAAIRSAGKACRPA
jgi:hypothetical protein